MIDTYIKKINEDPQYQLSLASIVKETISDGIGIRMSLYFNGCIHQCDECHNQSTWHFDKTKIVTKTDIITIVDYYTRNPILNGISLSGGDPLYNPRGMLLFLELLKKLLPDINIWCYTGYQYEQLIHDAVTSTLLKYIDVLVDGPFEKHNRVYDKPFIGSSNQRIIDVRASVTNNCIILLT